MRTAFKGGAWHVRPSDLNAVLRSRRHQDQAKAARNVVQSYKAPRDNGATTKVARSPQEPGRTPPG